MISFGDFDAMGDVNEILVCPGSILFLFPPDINQEDVREALIALKERCGIQAYGLVMPDGVEAHVVLDGHELSGQAFYNWNSPSPPAFPSSIMADGQSLDDVLWCHTALGLVCLQEKQPDGGFQTVVRKFREVTVRF